ncbi:MAG: C39 family peptidase [Patescibacteria group bacterium]
MLASFSKKHIVIVSVFGLIVLFLFVSKISFFESLASTPESLTLDVPFSPQAPTGIWENNENCEETSLIMAQAYFDGRKEKILPAAEVQQKIDELNAWEDKTFGHHEDTGADETSRMAKKVLDLDVRQIRDYTESDLKRALANGHVVLLPLSARLLENPQHYADGGPFYHMLAVIGYNEMGFIVHDPGSDDGSDNVYTFAILKNAAVDWDSKTQTTDPTRKIALIVSK